jgi:hypothetical protein
VRTRGSAPPKVDRFEKSQARSQKPEWRRCTRPYAPRSRLTSSRAVVSVWVSPYLAVKQALDNLIHEIGVEVAA